MWYTTLIKWSIKISCYHINKCRKEIGQCSISIYGKTLKTGYRATYLNIIKVVSNKPTADIILSGKKMIAFSLWVTIRVPTFATSIQYCIGGPNHSNWVNTYVWYPNWKERSKTLIICRKHGIMYRKSKRVEQKTVRTNKIT